MAKYRKKPVVIEAIQWNEENTMEILKWAGNKAYLYDSLYIKTLEGDHKATIGDYIIKGIKGEFYPCKPDIFEATYEKVEEGLKNHVKIKREKNKYSIVINGQEINKIIDYKLNVAHNYTNLTITIDVDELDVDLQ